MPSAELARNTSSLAANVVTWYWQQGVRRKGLHALSAGDWLRKCYEVSKRSDRLAAGSNSGRKALALWGPSQSGKSAFLSHFIDRPCGDFLSALQWTPDQQVEFLAKQPGKIALNPYNQMRDASGCITRFVLMEEPLSTKHPLEVILATREQLLLSLAIGYMTECRGPEPAVFWNTKGIEELLPAFIPDGKPDRAAYELLHDFISVVADMIHGKWNRYVNLERDWSAVSAQILEHPVLTSSVESATRFVSRVLWDGDEGHRLALLFEKLAKKLAALRALRYQHIVASYEVASFLLDIDAAGKIDKNHTVRLAYRMEEHRLVLGSGDGTPFDRHAIDFAAFQALISEIRVPLNKATLSLSAPEAAAVLAGVDFIDFPGVSRQGSGGHMPTIDQLDELQLYTQVLKRGKTASIFLSYSRNLSIDGVALLTRAMGGVYEPDQIISGVSAWVRAMGYDWPPRGPIPPLNIILTFSARLINEVADSIERHQKPQALDGIFSWFDRLGPIADPNWARFWATSYPCFHRDGGRVEKTPNEIRSACDLLMDEPAFRTRFGHAPTQLLEMAVASIEANGDGGVLSFISNLTAQLGNSDLESRRVAVIRQQNEILYALLTQAAPPQGVTSQVVKVEFDAWKQSILSALTADDSPSLGAKASRALMDLLHVDPDDLDVLPQNAAQKNIDGYIHTQVRGRWLPKALARGRLFNSAGVNSPAIASKRLTLLADHVAEFGAVAAWLKANLGHLARPEDCTAARRFLALHLSDLLFFGRERGVQGHRTPERDAGGQSEIQKLLQEFADEETRTSGKPDFKRAPHYVGVIVPFFRNLDAISSAADGQREPQAGDAEAIELLRSAETDNE